MGSRRGRQEEKGIHELKRMAEGEKNKSRRVLGKRDQLRKIKNVQ